MSRDPKPAADVMPLQLMRGPEREQLPAGLPMTMFLPHARQAERNHGQTLERLRLRGGLGPAEAVAILEDEAFEARPRSQAGSIAELAALIDAWNEEHPATVDDAD